ncbi:hypothetical protein Tco_1312941 [Tanacetum coccineum]
MLVQPTEDESEGLERQSEPQPIPSPPHSSPDQHETQTNPSPRPLPTTHITDSIPEGSGRNHGDQSSNQAKEIKHLKAQIKKLKKQAKPVITHHRAWMKSGRKFTKVEPTVHKDPAFDELDDDVIDYMETEDAQDVGRTRYVVSTDKEEVSTDRPDEGTVDQIEGRSATQTTPTTTPTIFRDDETIAQVLLNMSQAKAISREKEKGVELKDVENIERPRPTSTRSLLTLKPLPKIDPKDKGKKKIEEDESDTESEDINESEKKFKMLAHDEEIARKMQEDWEAEEERKRLAEEEATNAALIQDFDDIKARIEADRLLALRLQEEERESSSLWKKEQNSFMIQLQLKEGFLQNKELLPSETDLLQELSSGKVKRFDESFTVVGSNEDERKIKEMNEEAKDPGHNYIQSYKKASSTGEMNVLIFDLGDSTFDLLHIFDRQDLFHLYDLVMKQNSEVTLEEIELILWGDLKIMMDTTTNEIIKVTSGTIQQN